ncbi:hypothetical protein [Roseobacter sp. CCS2]|uniref:hypothetical protein n=1 Tax=Roseobacter sp. CCS2 TaxID=391593 RepID=UPI0000F3E4AF|nr:hypothetical protein [Roseobacter sp. CCS2]EBA12035.1 hypothetical protein RCCS2_12099 [Roseobacter sp. CCS2]
MRKPLLALPFLALAACSWTPLDECKRDVFFEGLDLEKQVQVTERNLRRGYGVGEMNASEFLGADELAWRSRCQSVAPDGTIAEFNCEVLLGAGNERVPISMRSERRLRERFIERLGGETRADTEVFVAREFAKCEQANPGLVGQNEHFSRDGAKELSIRQ